MRLAIKLTLAATIVFGTLSFQHSDADAVATRTSYYEYTQVWRSAVRFLRIDEGHTIIEQNLKAGYVVFEYKSGGKAYTGFLEIIRLVDRSGNKSVRMVIRIRHRPKYTEAGLLYRLELKMRKQLGPYHRPTPKPEPAPAPAKKPPAKNGIGIKTIKISGKK